MITSCQPKHLCFAVEPLWLVLLASQSCLSKIWSHLNPSHDPDRLLWFFYINFANIFLLSSGGLLGTSISSSFWSASFHGSISSRTSSISYLSALVSVHPNRTSMFEAPTSLSSFFFQFLGLLSLLASCSQQFATLCPTLPQWFHLPKSFLFSFSSSDLFFSGHVFCLCPYFPHEWHFLLHSSFVNAILPSPICVTPSLTDLILQATFMHLFRLLYIMSVLLTSVST